MKRKKETIGRTYAGTGVDYKDMDPFKIAAQKAAAKTAGNIKFGYSEVTASRGESVYLIETPDSYLAHVEEGLGTKNLVADAMYQLCKIADQMPNPAKFYEVVAIDTVAMIVNDMVTLGAMPLSLAMHLAVGNSDWFQDEARYQGLISGWKKGCNLSGCAWGGGETPTLRDIVIPGTFVLSGSAMGTIKPKKNIINRGPQSDDAIIIVRSSGIHANGLSLCRDIAAELPDGYQTIMPSGQTYGEALLTPTSIYVPLIYEALDSNIRINYTANITGHGWRKLMRFPGNFTYVIEKIPKPQEIFPFLQKAGSITNEEAYGNLNMGAGFALFVPQEEARCMIDLASVLGFEAFDAGYVQASPDRKVVIKPKRLVYTGDTLQIR